LALPARGADATLDIASWNLEWFGDPTNGPADETLQMQNARAVIASSDMDIWGMAEIVSFARWNQLKSELPGYSGFLASEDIVGKGVRHYDDTEQKVGILFRTSLGTVEDARLILPDNDAEFAGRPPLQVTLRATLNGISQDLVVIVLHAKCCSDETSWQHRLNASSALKTYLDANFPTHKVWVIGDFNDDIDTSITADRSSPYANFVADEAHYSFATRDLSALRIASTADFPDTIDHHLTTNEAHLGYLAGSAEVYRVDRYLANYRTTTSDHYPVFSHYDWDTTASSRFGDSSTTAAEGSGGNRATSDSRVSPEVIINEIGANEPGSDTASEFVELINAGAATVSLAGWALSDATSMRHVFASGTTLAPGKALVVIGSSAAAIEPELTNVVAASTGSLSLANGGDSVVLADASGSEVDRYTYTASLAANDGVSMNRTPDGGRNRAFVLHTLLSNLDRSPGKQADGTAW
jgi:hypothetical protein